MRQRIAAALPLLIGAGALLLLYGRLLIPGTAYLDRDLSGMHLPMLVALKRAAENGIPYWNPLVHGGHPLVTNPHYAAFYPPIWLVEVIPPHVLIGWLVVLHAIIAFAGTWRLAKSWGCESPAAALGAIAFVGSGAFCSTSSMLNLFMGAAWLPWVMLWGDRSLGRDDPRQRRRATVLLATTLAAQALTGSPVTSILSFLALLCLALVWSTDGWRRPVRLVSAGALALLLAAVQILPTLRHLTSSARSEGLIAKIATTWSTPPIRVLEMVWPRLFGDPSRVFSYLYAGYPGSELGIPLILSIYAGGLVLVLAGCAVWRLRQRHVVTLVAMSGLGLFLALGRYNPIYTSFLVRLPPFSIIRFPEKFIFLTTLGVSLLAAVGWQRALDRIPLERCRTLVGGFVVATLAFVGSVALYFAPLIAPELTLDLLQGVSPEALTWQDQEPAASAVPQEVLMVRAGLLGKELFLSIVVWGTALLLLLLHRSDRIRRDVLAAAVLVFVALDLAYYARGFNRPVSAEAALAPPATLAGLPPSTGRVFSDAILFGNSVVYFPDHGAEIPAELRRSFDRLDPYTANIWGYGYALNPDPDLMLTRSAQRALDSLVEASGLWQRGWTEEVYDFLGAWNIGIVVRRRSPQDQLEERRRTGRSPAPAKLIQNPRVLPRFRFVGEVATVPDPDSAVASVREHRFQLSDFDAIIRRTDDERLGIRSFDETAKVISVDDRGSEIIIEYDSPRSAFLVAAVTADRDWRARVDDDSIVIRETALGQMGLELPPGQRRVVLRLRNPAVLWGAGLSLLALTLGGISTLGGSASHE